MAQLEVSVQGTPHFMCLNNQTPCSTSQMEGFPKPFVFVSRSHLVKSPEKAYVKKNKIKYYSNNNIK